MLDLKLGLSLAKFGGKLTEVHLVKIIVATLLRKDVSEFRREWSKEKASAMLSMSVPESDDEDKLVDLDKTITEENKSGSLTAKKDFLIKFHQRKLLELGDQQVTERTLGEATKNDKRTNRTVRFRSGERPSGSRK